MALQSFLFYLRGQEQTRRSSVEWNLGPNGQVLLDWVLEGTTYLNEWYMDFD